jgi:hypothetical protein
VIARTGDLTVRRSELLLPDADAIPLAELFLPGAPAMTESVSAPETRLLRAGVAFIWLATGVLVLHPYYREVGEYYLGELGLPARVMIVTCVAEVFLGLAVLFAPLPVWLAGVQVALIGGFTVVLAWLEPGMLAHPFGLLSKNVPLAAMVVALWYIDREGWTPRARGWLVGGLAVFWIWEGLLPNTFAQGPAQRAVIASVGIPEQWGSLLLPATGIAMALSALGLLVLRGTWLRWLLAGQMLLVLGVCVVVTCYDARLWFHPFGPLTKNVSLLLATAALLQHSCKE